MAQDLIQLTETVLQTTVAALAVSGYATLTGEDDADETVPCVICVAENIGEEIPPGLGNHNVSCRISVQSNATDTSLASHSTNVSTVFDAFRSDGIVATLNGNISGWTAFGIVRRGYNIERDEKKFVDEMLFDLYCCPSEIG